MTKRPFRIGTRGSALALWQANHISDLLSQALPELHTEIVVIKTTGDRNLESPLSEIGGKGVFVKEIEDALLGDRIDIAVHSMKDLPAFLPEGLTIGAVAERHDPRDVLISKRGFGLRELPRGSRVGTGSLRRAAQILSRYPGLKIVPIRGNVDTRIKKLREGDDYDSIILAAAGIWRMGLSHEATEIIPADLMIPAPGQGIIAIECRESDPETLETISEINHTETSVAASAERAFLERLAGDCNVPVGCYAELNGNLIHIRAVLASPDGGTLIREEVKGRVEYSAELGRDLADLVLDEGGREILESLPA
jgi:hydroxymethylbilane synthase